MLCVGSNKEPRGKNRQSVKSPRMLRAKIPLLFSHFQGENHVYRVTGKKCNLEHLSMYLVK